MFWNVQSAKLRSNKIMVGTYKMTRRIIIVLINHILSGDIQSGVGFRTIRLSVKTATIRK